MAAWERGTLRDRCATPGKCKHEVSRVDGTGGQCVRRWTSECAGNEATKVEALKRPDSSSTQLNGGPSVIAGSSRVPSGVFSRFPIVRKAPLLESPGFAREIGLQTVDGSRWDIGAQT